MDSIYKILESLNKVSEAVDPEVEKFMDAVVAAGDEGYEMLADAQIGKYGDAVRKFVDNMYANASQEIGGHPDDDQEQILDKMMDFIHADFPAKKATNEGADPDPEIVEKFARVSASQRPYYVMKWAEENGIDSNDAMEMAGYERGGYMGAGAYNWHYVGESVKEAMEDDYDGASVEDIASAITQRMMRAKNFGALVREVDILDLNDAIESVAEFHEGGDLGTSDVSNMVRDVLKQLGKEDMKLEDVEVKEAVSLDQAREYFFDKHDFADENIQGEYNKMASKMSPKDAMALKKELEEFYPEALKEQDVEEDNAFNTAAANAKKAGQSHFMFNGKKYKVQMDADTADALTDDVNEDAYSEMPEEMKKKIIAQYAKMVGGDVKKAEAMLRKALSPEGQAVIKDKMGIKDSLGEDYDKDEYDEEGEMADNQLDVVHDAAQELQDIIDSDDNLPEWVQSKITKAMDYLDTARDYMKSVEDDEEDADDVEPPKDEGDEEVEETTTAGAVATSVDGAGIYKNASVYEGYNSRVDNMITEGMNVNISASDQGEPSVSVTATGEDAMALAQLLQLAAVPQQPQAMTKKVCKNCGDEQGKPEHMDCPYDCMDPMGENFMEVACEADEANSADNGVTYDMHYLINSISGGLNGPKKQINPNNPGDNPMAMTGIGKDTLNMSQQVSEGEDVKSHLETLYKEFKSK